MFGIIEFLASFLVLSLLCVYLCNMREIKNIYDLGRIAQREYRGFGVSILFPTVMMIFVAFIFA